MRAPDVGEDGTGLCGLIVVLGELACGDWRAGPPTAGLFRRPVGVVAGVVAGRRGRHSHQPRDCVEPSAPGELSRPPVSEAIAESRMTDYQPPAGTSPDVAAKFILGLARLLSTLVSVAARSWIASACKPAGFEGGLDFRLLVGYE